MISSRCSTLLMNLAVNLETLSLSRPAGWHTRARAGRLGSREPAQDAFAARTVILERLAVAHRIIEPEFVDDGFQIVEPELGHKPPPPACALRLRHLPCAFLVKLDADRRRALHDVK